MNKTSIDSNIYENGKISTHHKKYEQNNAMSQGIIRHIQGVLYLLYFYGYIILYFSSFGTQKEFYRCHLVMYMPVVWLGNMDWI